MVTVLAISDLYYAISKILTRYLAAQTEMVEPLPAEPPVAEVEFEPVSVATQAPPADDDVEAPSPVQVVPPPMLAMPPPLALAIAVSDAR
ncbi:unnamed protein product [Lupinus luteus]|uniref:Uncharacterized protein n=1 Tax=Lupinus luteus TaxID=3873 RepID=A0AAV1WEF0_LUPLU